MAGDELRKHAARVFEQAAPEVGLGDADTLGDPGQMPDRVDGGLGDADVAVAGQDGPVRAEPASGDRVLDFRHVDPRLGDGDGRANVEAVGELIRERLADQMAERIERNDSIGVEPLWMRPDADGGGGILQIGRVRRIEGARGDRERAVDRIGSGRRTDGVARLVGKRRGQDRAALDRVRRAPMDRWRRPGALARMRGQDDMTLCRR